MVVIIFHNFNWKLLHSYICFQKEFHRKEIKKLQVVRDETVKKEEGEERSDGEVVDDEDDEDKENKESDSEDEGEVNGDQEEPARKVEKKEESSPEKSKYKDKALNLSRFSVDKFWSSIWLICVFTGSFTIVKLLCTRNLK